MAAGLSLLSCAVNLGSNLSRYAPGALQLLRGACRRAKTVRRADGRFGVCQAVLERRQKLPWRGTKVQRVA